MRNMALMVIDQYNFQEYRFRYIHFHIWKTLDISNLPYLWTCISPCMCISYLSSSSCQCTGQTCSGFWSRDTNNCVRSQAAAFIKAAAGLATSAWFINRVLVIRQISIWKFYILLDKHWLMEIGASSSATVVLWDKMHWHWMQYSAVWLFATSSLENISIHTLTYLLYTNLPVCCLVIGYIG